jgi:hypothetical protein
MPAKLLSSFKHYCFHSHRPNLHQFPDLYRCAKGDAHGELMKANKATANHPDRCTASITLELATQAGLVDEKGNVTCPVCDGPTVLKPGETRLEIHVKLCTDETIHYPEMRKAGKITEDEYQKWKATLSLKELRGEYKRVPDIPVMAKFTGDEVALLKSDPVKFNELMNTRLKERAEAALLHQVPYRHTTTKVSL